jgi:GTP-binding protein EngB required for normal cell division
MVCTKFEMLEWIDQGNQILRRARNTLSSAPSQKMQQLAERIPATILPSDDPVMLVFAGQYSAGKSTIIKALTGREDIAIGAGITTEKADTYDWEGLQVVDTPGVHTELRPDHDEITYRAIADADLLVFVVTNELFDSHLARHFRKLAIEQDKAHEMMLVVNKMRRCAKGNSPEVQDVIREDLQRVLAPFTPDDLRTSFIDAETACESKAETDPAVAKLLWRKSGMEEFTQTLNGFARDKGLAGRYTTTLYNLEQILQEALAGESTGDKDVNALEELLLQRRRALSETKVCIERAVNDEIQPVVSKVRQEGRKIADMINVSADPKEANRELEEVNRELEAAQERVQRYTEQLGQSVQQIISTHMTDLDQRVEFIANSELAKELLLRLAHRIKEVGISPEMMTNLKMASGMSSKLGEFLVRNSFTPEADALGGLFKLNQYSGTATHDAVKTLGHFFWEIFQAVGIGEVDSCGCEYWASSGNCRRGAHALRANQGGC